MVVFEDFVDRFAVSHFMRQLGESAIIRYTDADGNQTTGITAIVDDEKIRHEVTVNGLKKIRSRNVTCHVDPNSKWKGIADPDLNGVIRYNNTDWKINDILDRDGVLVQFEMVFHRAQQLESPDLRR